MSLLHRSTHPIRVFRRFFKQLCYETYGNPLEVLKLTEQALPCHTSTLGMAKVKILMSPINPADINTIQGVYPIKPSLPAVPGGECVAEVIAGNSFRPGDRVIVLKLGWGTWKENGHIEEKYLYKVPSNLSPEIAATLSVNPCTSYRMLKDFVDLKKGDVVIQNGANSAVGQFVIQLCRFWGIKTVNVVRNREDISNLKNYLTDMGADVVVTEEELSKGYSKLELQLPKPRLALNCVGGRSATELSRSLSNGGYMVTYGGMSKQPVILPTAHFIFNDVKSVGFWMSRWKDQHEGHIAMNAMLDELCSLFIAGHLKPTKYRKFGLDQWKEAVAAATKGFMNEKVLLTLNG